MAGAARACMADWLALNALDRSICLKLLEQAGSGSMGKAADPPYPGPPPWPLVLVAMAQVMPEAAPLLERIRTHARIDLAPDPTRSPRPFTLHDVGNGLPFLSCPLKGRLSDLLVLAHELGHALQIVASGRPDLPPVQRETAALLAERLVTPALRDDYPGLAVLLAHREARLLGRHAGRLRAALDDPGAPYLYDWNYPVAVVLARWAGTRFTPADLWQVFAGGLPLPRMVACAAL